MPCNSDHLNPNEWERESKEAAQHLVYAMAALGTEIPGWIAKAAGDYYGCPERINELTVMLCNLCKRLEAEDSLILWNGRDWQARSLANWWEAHKQADAAREEREREAEERRRLKKQALSKLTEEEIEALRLS